MLSPAYSVYGDAYFFVAYGVFGVCATAFLSAACAVLVPSLALKRPPSSRAVVASGVCLLASSVMVCLAIATLSAFEYASLWFSAIACVFVWAIVTVPVGVSTSAELVDILAKRIKLKTMPGRKLSSGSDAAASDIELRTRNASLGSGASNGASRASTASTGPDLVPTARLLRDYRAWMGFLRSDMRRRWPVYAAIFGFGLVVAAISIATLFGACVCAQPTELSTWIQRATTPALCAKDTVCHLYSLVGKDCTELVIVGHIVLHSGDEVVSALVSLSYTTNATNGTTTNNSSTRIQTTTPCLVTPVNDIVEDWRFVVAAVVAVEGSTTYNVSVTATTANGRTVSTSSVPMMVRSLSCVSSSDHGLEFFAGGDYRVRGVGQVMLRRGAAVAKSAEFYFVGGDLAYANNMRRCYRRWDLYLNEVIAAAVTDNGSLRLPMLIAVGNHEGGGYLQAASRGEREQRFPLFGAYFPHYLSSATQPFIDAADASGGGGTASPVNATDPTLTMHAHAIGDSLAIVVLDSDIMVAAADQVAFLHKAAEELPWYRDASSIRDGRPLPNPSGRRLAMIYHNPAYPSMRDPDGVVTTSVRTTFVSTFELINNQSLRDSSVPRIACVFEHHDHAYKRTFPIAANRISTLAEGAIVYIGDGSLGATPKLGPLSSPWYLERAEVAPYILRVRTFSNTTFEVVSYRSDGSVLDEFRS